MKVETSKPDAAIGQTNHLRKLPPERMNRKETKKKIQNNFKIKFAWLARKNKLGHLLFLAYRVFAAPPPMLRLKYKYYGWKYK